MLLITSLSFFLFSLVFFRQVRITKKYITAIHNVPYSEFYFACASSAIFLLKFGTIYIKIRISATSIVDSARQNHKYEKGKKKKPKNKNTAFHRSHFSHHSDKIIAGPVILVRPHGHRTPSL